MDRTTATVEDECGGEPAVVAPLLDPVAVWRGLDGPRQERIGIAALTLIAGIAATNRNPDPERPLGAAEVEALHALFGVFEGILPDDPKPLPTLEALIMP